MENRAARAKAARRAAERRILAQRIELSRTTDERTKARIETTIGKLRSLAEQTRLYSGGKKIAGRTTAFREAAISQLELLNKSVGTRGKSRAFEINKQFAEQINTATGGTKIDTMTENQARSFLRVTQRSWEGKDVQTRYVAMQEFYGTSSLRDIFDAFDFYFGKQVEVLEKAQRNEQLTDEEKALLIDLKREDDEQEKRYRKDDATAPKKGSIASMFSSDALTKEMFDAYIEHRNSGTLDNLKK